MDLLPVAAGKKPYKQPMNVVAQVMDNTVEKLTSIKVTSMFYRIAVNLLGKAHHVVQTVQQNLAACALVLAAASMLSSTNLIQDMINILDFSLMIYGAFVECRQSQEPALLATHYRTHSHLRGPATIQSFKTLYLKITALPTDRPKFKMHSVESPAVILTLSTITVSALSTAQTNIAFPLII